MLKNFLQIHINIDIKRTTTLNIIIKVITIAKQKNIVKVITLWYDISVKIGGREVSLLRKKKEPIKEKTLYNIAEFNRGQASKIIRHISEEDETALVLKHGKPIAVIISIDKHNRLLEKNIDINTI